MAKKSWDKTSYKREKKLRKQRALHRYLIVCEDEKSSHLYLKAFPYDIDVVQIETEGGCGETLSVVQKGLSLRAAAEKAGAPFVQTYCVIDRDEHPKDRYLAAFAEADKYNDVRVFWANEAFELWYLLHYDYLDAPLHRADLCRNFAKLLKRDYDKSDDSIYQALADKAEAAIRNATKLEKHNSGVFAPHLENPSTNIHKLIIVLRDLAALKRGEEPPGTK